MSKDIDNITPIEKQNLFKEQYSKKLQGIQKLKDNFIKNNSLSLKYITDRTAFKIPYNGVICDWHSVAMLNTNHYLLHPINIIGAETIFLDYGLYDCSEYFKSENRDIFELTGTNFCATPIRAILDILFENIYVLNRYPKKLEHFHNDYMMDGIDYDELFEKIAILRENFNDAQKVILNEFFEKELKNSKSVYSNEVVYDRKKELYLHNPNDYTFNCFWQTPFPAKQTVTSIIRNYLGTMNKQDIHTLCKKFGKDRVLKELNDKYKELFEIGYFDFKGMKIPLEGDYKDYELFKILLEIVNSYKGL